MEKFIPLHMPDDLWFKISRDDIRKLKSALQSCHEITDPDCKSDYEFDKGKVVDALVILEKFKL